MIELQKLVYFTEGNTFYGSHSEAGRSLRFRVAPDRENGCLLASRWQEDKCFERAQSKEDAEFPLSEEGLEQLRQWLIALWEEAGA